MFSIPRVQPFPHTQAQLGKKTQLTCGDAEARKIRQCMAIAEEGTHCPTTVANTAMRWRFGLNAAAA